MLDSRSGVFLDRVVSLRPAVLFEFLNCFSSSNSFNSLQFLQFSHVDGVLEAKKSLFFFTRLPKEELKLNILSCGARGSTRGHEKASTQEGSSGKTSHYQKRYCKYPPVILVIHFYIICT